MPELPEVEHARAWLSRWIAGGTISKVVVEDERILDEGATSAAIRRTLKGRHVDAVERRGKWIRIPLDGGKRLIFSHLGMTGKWALAEAKSPPLRFEKVRIDVVRKGKTSSARYLDPRLFGRFVVSSETIAAFAELGPDPLHDGIDAEALRAALSRRTIAIKPALLDQTILAGVGNIQATEALFFAKIDPRRPANGITRREASALRRGILKSIEETMAAQEGPNLRYVEEPGSDNPFTVYGHEGEPCPRCKTLLAKIVLGGRGTVFCPGCQG